ncbi:MAG: class I SAM-dependent methyltransferase [Methanoregulaceae archaeon]|nr:class I SAM-dependent methyltransferase [Methanoregulaceae archaeon]
MANFSPKINLGPGPNWELEGWESLDHSTVTPPFRLRAQAWSLPYPDASFEVVFTSNMIEHISQFKIEEVICEINRILKPGGIARIIAPDLRKFATAYVNNDWEEMKKLRPVGFGWPGGVVGKSDLGLGQVFMNEICSAGMDNFLLSSDYSTIYAGYAHIYAYDFEMLAGLLKYYGFSEIRRCRIDESDIQEHKELTEREYDLHADSSLIVECRKERFVPFSPEKALLHTGPYNIKNLSPIPYSPIWLSLKFIGHIRIIYLYIRSKTPASVLRPFTKMLNRENKTEE